MIPVTQQCHTNKRLRVPGGSSMLFGHVCNLFLLFIRESINLSLQWNTSFFKWTAPNATSGHGVHDPDHTTEPIATHQESIKEQYLVKATNWGQHEMWKLAFRPPPLVALIWPVHKTFARQWSAVGFWCKSPQIEWTYTGALPMYPD